MANFTERNQNSVPALTAKSNAADNADVIVWADPATHRLLVNASVTVGAVSGSKTNNNAAPGADNIGAFVGVATAAAPSYTEGNLVALSTDLSGALRVTGSLSIGGSTVGAAVPSSVTVIGMSDGTNTQIPKLYDLDSGAGTDYVAGNSIRLSNSGGSGEIKNGQGDGASATFMLNVLPMMYNGSTHDRFRGAVNALNSVGTGLLAVAGAAQFDDTSPTAITENQFGNLRISANRNLYVTLRDAAGNERGLNIDASGQLAVTVASGTVTTVSTVTNLAQMNGAVLLMGNGTTGTGSQRVTIASDNTAFTVNPASATAPVSTMNSASAAAGVTSALALVFDDVAPTAITENSFGYARMSANRNQYVTIRDAAGNERGLNIDASGQIATNVAQINGITVLMGNGVTGTGSQRVTLASDNSAVALWGQGATAATVPANAVLRGGRGATANPTAVTDGQMVGAMADKLGRTVVVVGHVRDMKANQITTITASTSETTVVTAVASTFLDVYGCIVVNSSATATNVSFKDSTAGTTQFNVYVPAGETRGFMLPSSDGFKQTTVNTNWTATSSASVTSLVISMLFVKNI